MVTTAISVMDLPTELIHHVIAELSPHTRRTDLWSLCLTSRRLYAIAEEHLYSHIRLSIVEDEQRLFSSGSFDEWRLQSSALVLFAGHRVVRQLLRTLIERPALRQLVKSVTHKASYVHLGSSRDKNLVQHILAAPESTNIPSLSLLRAGYGHGDVDVGATYLLLLLPELRHLIIDVHETYDWDEEEVKVPFSHVLELLKLAGSKTPVAGFHGFTSLTSLDLSFRFGHPRGLMSGRILLIPSLRKVRLRHASFEPHWDCPPYSSLVTELCLDECQYDWQTFLPLLQSFEGLKAFLLGYSDGCHYNVLDELEVRTHIITALEVQKHALEIVELWYHKRNSADKESVTWTPQESSDICSLLGNDFAQLRNFLHLRSLTLSRS